MPYITKERQWEWTEVETAIRNCVDKDTTKGDLNYLLSITIGQYLLAKGLSYDAVNDVRGALENCTSEFYRRIALPYEDKKIRENGDIRPYAILTDQLFPGDSR